MEFAIWYWVKIESSKFYCSLTKTNKVSHIFPIWENGQSSNSDQKDYISYKSVLGYIFLYLPIL